MNNSKEVNKPIEVNVIQDIPEIKEKHKKLFWGIGLVIVSIVLGLSVYCLVNRDTKLPLISSMNNIYSYITGEKEETIESMNINIKEPLPENGVTSPDGKMIAYKKYKDDTKEILPNIYIYFTESKTSEPYFSINPDLMVYLGNSKLSWSPDSKEIIVWNEGQVYGYGKILIYSIEKRTNIAVLVTTSNKILWGNDNEVIYIEPLYKCDNGLDSNADCPVSETTIKKYIVSEQKSLSIVDNLSVTSDFYPLYSLYKVEKNNNEYEVYYIIFLNNDELETYKINSDGTGKEKL